MTPIATTHLVLLLALLAVAAYADLASRRIPNWVPVAIAATGIAAQLARAGERAALAATVASLVALAVLLVPWRLRLMGGGDAKLAVALVAWVYPDRLTLFLLAAAISGVALAVPYLGGMLRRAAAARAVAGSVSGAAWAVGRQAGATREVPFGVAIALGGALAVLWR